MAFQIQVAIVGGGLAGGLIAYRLKRRFPELSLALFEASETLGGNHTWSFHSADLADDDLLWLQPMIRKSWSGYQVNFPEYQRSFTSEYHSISSELFHEVVSQFLSANQSLYLGSAVESCDERQVVLKDGRVFVADLVLDARGFTAIDQRKTGFQKFVGWDVELESPHGLNQPTIKDVTIPQLDGYRFFYLLPWDEKSLLVEDTRYSNEATIDLPHFESEIQSYIQARGWKIVAVHRKEVAALPIPMNRDFAKSQTGSALPIGVRAGYFNSTTGYSMPDALRVATGLCQALESGLDFTEVSRFFLQNYSRKVEERERFYRLLNRMMFRAAVPEQRYKILQRFYRLPEGLVKRFYSGDLKWQDRLRILSGKPPVPIARAVSCLREASV